MTEHEATYYAHLGPGDAVATPRHVLRRVSSVTTPNDEVLGPDGQWRATDLLVAVELGQIDGRLLRLPDPLAQSMIDHARRNHAQLNAALDRQAAGRFALRLARQVEPARGEVGTPVADIDWDPAERASVVAFLRQAPLALQRDPSPDPFDADAVVQSHVHTDGLWVWPESLADLADRYGVPPEAPFLDHITAHGYRFPPALTAEVLDRARQLAETGADSADPVSEPSAPGQPPRPTQQERLQALANWHREWQLKHADSTPLQPVTDAADSDHNIHHVDVDASPEADWEFTRRAREIMGLDPETGARVDE